MDLHSRIGKTTAVAGRIAKLMESMHNKLEVVEADKEKLQKQLEKEEKIEFIAARMKEEANRIKNKEEELSRREEHLKQRERDQAEQITSHKVKELYLRIEEQGDGIATRSSLMRCLRTDEDMRAVFCGNGITAENVTATLEKIFSNTSLSEERIITYDEFSLAVLGPGHPCLRQGSYERSPQKSQPNDQFEAITDVCSSERSPPPFRLPDLSPMMQSPPQCHEPPPPAFHSTGRPAVDAESPFLQIDNPFITDFVSENEMFTDSQFPPEFSSFAPNPSDGLLWQRTSGGTLFPKTPQCSTVIAGICSNRKWLSAMCLIADPFEIIDSTSTSIERGYAEVNLSGEKIIVDNYFPSIHGCPAHASTPTQLWIMFAEKALAKTKGGYSFLERSRYEKLSELVPIARPGAQAAVFPMEMDSMVDLVESVAASHLQLLTPRPTAASRLDDIGTLYSICELYPKNETNPSNCYVLIFSPVISQGAQDAPDAKWVKATDLLQLFSTWTLIDVNSTFLKRRQTRVDLPRHPDVVIDRLSPIPNKAFSVSSTAGDLGDSLWGQFSDNGEGDIVIGKSEGRESIERSEPVSCGTSPCDTKESEVDGDGGDQQRTNSPSPTTQISNWKEQTKCSNSQQAASSSRSATPSSRSPSIPSSVTLPKTKQTSPTTNWNETMNMVLSSNTAIMKEVQAHKSDAEQARSQLEDERQQHKESLKEFEQKNYLLTEEIATLQSLLSEKQREENECNKAYNTLGYEPTMTLSGKAAHLIKRFEELVEKDLKMEEAALQFDKQKAKLKTEYETAFEVQQDRIKECEAEKLKIAKTLFAEREATEQLKGRASEADQLEKDLSEHLQNSQSLQQRVQDLEVELLDSASNYRSLEQRLSEPSSETLQLRDKLTSLQSDFDTLAESQRVFEAQIQQTSDERVDQMQSDLDNVITELQSDLATSQQNGIELDRQLRDSRKQAALLEAELSRLQDEFEQQAAEVQTRIKKAMEGFHSNEELQNAIKEKDLLIKELQSQILTTTPHQNVELQLAAEVRIQTIESNFESERRLLKNQIAELEATRSGQQRDLEVQNAINSHNESPVVSSLQEELSRQKSHIQTLESELDILRQQQTDPQERCLARDLEQDLQASKSENLEIESLKQQLASHREVVEEQTDHIAKLQQRLEEEGTGNGNCDNCNNVMSKMNMLEEEICRVEESNIQKQRAIAQLTEWIQHMSDTTNQKRITESEERVALLQEHVDSTIRRCDSSTKEHNILREQVVFLEKQLEIQKKSHQSEVDTLNAKLQTHEEEIPKLNKQLQDIISLHHELGRKHLRVVSEIEERKRSGNTATEDSKEDHVQQLTSKLETSKREIDEFALKIASLESVIEEITTERDALLLESQPPTREPTPTEVASPQRLEALEAELAETKRLHHQISLKWKRSVTNSHEVKKELAACKEQLQQLDEYKAAMKVAAIEIEALHRSRDESKQHSKEATNRLRKHLDEAQEENSSLRMEMVKIIAERNLLYQQLTGGTPSA